MEFFKIFNTSKAFYKIQDTKIFLSSFESLGHSPGTICPDTNLSIEALGNKNSGYNIVRLRPNTV